MLKKILNKIFGNKSVSESYQEKDYFDLKGILIKPLTITITEEDRIKAKDFSDNENCLIATSIKRIIGNNRELNVGTWECYIDRTPYQFNQKLGTSFVEENSCNTPFYDSKVVGKSFIIFPN